MKLTGRQRGKYSSRDDRMGYFGRGQRPSGAVWRHFLPYPVLLIINSTAKVVNQKKKTAFGRTHIGIDTVLKAIFLPTASASFLKYIQYFCELRHSL